MKSKTKFFSTFASELSPDILNEAQVEIYSRETCNSRQVLDGSISETMFCAGKLQGGVDTCQVSHSHTHTQRLCVLGCDWLSMCMLQGDSGGPLVVKKDNVWWLAGDTSWGIGCALRNKPGVYGNISHFVDWIHQQMKQVARLTRAATSPSSTSLLNTPHH